MFVRAVVAIAALVAMACAGRGRHGHHGGRHPRQDGHGPHNGRPRSILVSSAFPIANPPRRFSLLADRGVVAGTCADSGFPYVFQFGDDERLGKNGWDERTAASKRIPGKSAPLCGYGYHKFHNGAEGLGLVMLDVGANIGLSAFPYWARGYKVIAFEPIPSNVANIRANIFVNGIFPDEMVLVHAAVGDSTGNITIYDVPGRSDNAALGADAATRHLKGKAQNAIDVPILRLDDYLDNAPAELKKKIAFVKIDVQGSELLVLRGMKKFLQNPPTPADLGGFSFMVIAEYAPSLQASSGHKATEMLSFMVDLGYEMRCSPEDADAIPAHMEPKCGDVVFSKGRPMRKPRAL